MFLAADWAEQRRVAQALGGMVRNTYVLSYYTSNDNPGFRKLQVRVKGGDSYAIRCGPAITRRLQSASGVER